MKTRIALAQINVTVGDFAGNVAKIVDAARAAHNDGAKLLVAPELALSGYPPEDLLLRPAFYAASAAALADLAEQLKPFAGLHVVVGHPHATPRTAMVKQTRQSSAACRQSIPSTRPR
jgi:NAD+ synthase (glutamine-hydrolysing)